MEEILTKLKHLLETADLPFDISGAVVFGSQVKGTATESSDYDILIVAEGIDPKRHRRGREILLIKKALLRLPLDIILMTPAEVDSNFRNHNPLFLDIAEDGILILDKDNFLRDLMLETREYIRQRGIERFGDGWSFSVQKGVPTYLSKISNRDFSHAMLKDGERDFIIGERLMRDGFYDKAVYHFQQSIEKAVKSVLIALGVFQKTHFIGGILRKLIAERELSERWKRDLSEVADISEEIEPEVSLSRYPGIIDDSLWLPFDEYEKKDADRAMKKATRVLHVTKVFIKEWFSEGL